MTSKQLIEYVVLDIEPADHSKGRFALARAEVRAVCRLSTVFGWTWTCLFRVPPPLL